jgi:creatinine amidohydrolase/Fe(II)-dependent formamide hydrolase-like protein
VARWLRAQGGRAEDAGAHAGRADTSQLMAVDPKLVRTDRLATVTVGPATGVAASPAGASAAQGRRMLELRVDAAVAQITRLTAAGR